ncbi:MAG: A/G-specific adenine glycosylase, partial [Minisyncoccia bacterium]
MHTDSIETLLAEAKAFYATHARRGLPWRTTRDPYRILVSEVMLQQTQADRVRPFYRAFITRFPTARALAKADLPAVFGAWSGLGYNRRAKLLRDAARTIRDEFGGRFPREVEA